MVKQRMVFENKQAKGLKAVLQERGLYREGMRAREMRQLLGAQPDFKSQKRMVEELCAENGVECAILPVHHPELSPLDSHYWAMLKDYLLKHCDYTMRSLRVAIPEGLASITLANIRSYFDKVHAWESAYARGLGYLDAKAEVDAGAAARRASRKASGQPAESKSASRKSVSSRAEHKQSAKSSGKPTSAKAKSAASPPIESKTEPKAKAKAKAKAKPKAKAKAKAKAAGKRKQSSGAVLGLWPGIDNFDEENEEARVCFAIVSQQLINSYPQFAQAFDMLHDLPGGLALCSDITQAMTSLQHSLRPGSDPNEAFQRFCRVALTDEDTRFQKEYAAGHCDAGELLMDIIRHERDDGGVQAALGALNPFGCTQFRVVEEFTCSRGVGTGACKGQWTARRKRGQRYDDVLTLPVEQVAANSDVVKAVIHNTAPERLKEVRCHSCHTKGGVDRCFRYITCPSLLVILISRWKRGRKSSKHVSVPRSAHVDALNSDYDFVAAGCHHGSSLRSGHWTAVASRGDPVQWLKFNDNAVSAIDLDAVLASVEFRSSVCVVLYKRVGERHVAPEEAMDTDNDDDSDVEMDG
jgi:hypothetical protein